jgi:hypothetical protein
MIAVSSIARGRSARVARRTVNDGDGDSGGVGTPLLLLLVVVLLVVGEVVVVLMSGMRALV